MRRLIALTLLIFLLPLIATAHKADDFSLSITLTRGESSRDSNSETTTIKLEGRALVYEKSFGGYMRGRGKPVTKSFRIKDEDFERLKNLVREKKLLISDSLELKGNSKAEVRRYFVITLNISLDGKKSTIDIKGPKNASKIKEKKIYQKANALLEAVYKIINEQDGEIGYENRDLIGDSVQ